MRRLGDRVDQLLVEARAFASFFENGTTIGVSGAPE
jgi:hypothetical protein